LATRGYSVLFPDAPLRLGLSMQDVVRTVLPGVNAAVDLGYADPERLAVMGQSYGSYSVLSLITQTDRFKAAVISAVAAPDLVTGYLYMSPDGVGSETGFYENGQGNMGGTPWDNKDRYLENSPLFLFDRIQTPLLMAHGTKDFLPLRYADSVFVALQRLGKDVEYRIYQDEEHVITRKPNVIDFWQRQLDFLAEHLNLDRDSDGKVQLENSQRKRTVKSKQQLY
jgi:dipeptidyl aminopeptidase/acylaminoacyl peptidase